MVDSVDTFDMFEPELLALVKQGLAENKPSPGQQARAQKIRTRHQLRRAASEARLAEILPARIDVGDSWHVMSHGDIDALSYLSHALSGAGHLDRVVLSTWVMARTDIDQLAAWLDAGLIGSLEIYVGEIFPGQQGDEYAQLLGMARVYGCRVVVARNHSKVTLMHQAETDYFLVAESSANVNTNPRIEQTALHASRELFDFYLDFFHGLKTIDKASK